MNEQAATDSAGGGYVCPNCGVWVQNGIQHTCYRWEQNPQQYYTWTPNYSAELGRIATALESILAELTRKERNRCLNAVATIRAYYDESVFLPESKSIDAESARWARQVCDNIKEEILAQTEE